MFRQKSWLLASKFLATSVLSCAILSAQEQPPVGVSNESNSEREDLPPTPPVVQPWVPDPFRIPESSSRQGSKQKASPTLRDLQNASRGDAFHPQKFNAISNQSRERSRSRSNRPSETIDELQKHFIKSVEPNESSIANGLLLQLLLDQELASKGQISETAELPDRTNPNQSTSGNGEAFTSLTELNKDKYVVATDLIVAQGRLMQRAPNGGELIQLKHDSNNFIENENQTLITLKHLWLSGPSESRLVFLESLANLTGFSPVEIALGQELHKYERARLGYTRVQNFFGDSASNLPKSSFNYQFDSPPLDRFFLRSSELESRTFGLLGWIFKDKYSGLARISEELRRDAGGRRAMETQFRSPGGQVVLDRDGLTRMRYDAEMVQRIRDLQRSQVIATSPTAFLGYAFGLITGESPETCMNYAEFAATLGAFIRRQNLTRENLLPKIPTTHLPIKR